MKAKPIRFHHISLRILVVFGLVVVASLGSTGLFVMQVGEGLLTRKISEGDLSLARRTAQNVDMALASASPTLSLLAGVVGRHFEDLRQLRSDLDSIKREFPEVRSIYVADAKGEQLVRTGGGVVGDVSTLLSYQTAMSGKTLLSAVYLDPSTMKPLRTISLPILRAGKVLGALSADMGFDRIALSLGAAEGDSGATILVVSGNGRLIAHTRLGEIKDYDLSGQAAVEAVLAGKEGLLSGYWDELGRKVLGTYSPIKTLGWGVVIQRPLSAIAAELRSLRTTILVCLAISILFAIGTGYLMSRGHREAHTALRPGCGEDCSGGFLHIARLRVGGRDRDPRGRFQPDGRRPSRPRGRSCGRWGLRARGCREAEGR